MVVPGSIADSLGPQSPAAASASNHPDEISAAQNSAAPRFDEAPAVPTTGDPWAPPITSIPGVATAAPTPPAVIAPVTAPPIAPPPAPSAVPAESRLVGPPPAAVPETPVAAPEPVAVTPVAAPTLRAPTPPAAPSPAPAPPATELLPDFDDTIIADELPDFDDTVIVGRKSPVWILEPGGSKAIRITSPVALLGRNPSVNAAFPDAQLVLVPDSSKTMSKNHARIALDDGVWTIYDLGSTNGIVLVSEGEETVLESGASATLTETFKLGELPIRLTPEL